MIGRIYGRLLGSPNAFQPQSFVRPVNATVEQNYVDGISITHGHPRNHIWTLATSVSFISPFNCFSHCNQNKPAFVEENFSCELHQNCGFDDVCHAHNLWSGEQCVGPSIFYRQLPYPTTDDIEMRVCRDEDGGNEDILITLVEIYVQ